MYFHIDGLPEGRQLGEDNRINNLANSKKANVYGATQADINCGQIEKVNSGVLKPVASKFESH